MKKLTILLILFSMCIGCSSVKNTANVPQLWKGTYDHPGQEMHTTYILSYNIKNTSPKLSMETFGEDDIRKVSVRELTIVDKGENSVTLVPSDVYGTEQYDPKRDAIVFTIHNELQAEITSIDKDFVLLMMRVEKGK